MSNNDTDSASSDPDVVLPHIVLVETSTWGAICTIIVALRYISQWSLRKTRKWVEIDDFLMIFALGAYITTITSINIFSRYNEIVGVSPSFNSEQAARTIGIIGTVNETAMLSTLWSLKFCLLLIYARLIPPAGKLYHSIKFVAIYCALGFIVCIVCFYGVFCTPFSEFFAVNPTNEQCYLLTHYFIVQMVFNVSSDLMIFLIPMIMLFTSLMELRQKLLLLPIFSLGVFIILAAILTKYITISNPATTAWELWYAREASVSMIITNVPLCMPMGYFS
ncbi:hypothetical protein BP6252_13619 [Coleophoma cylindrospora]|uniref:Rhodopsin domain-containing protein n=1 Tax=Coleophoma cylindrospora TaxID=1849047 RepID=A0A3D8Q9A2_9HELO|nr:hypothetical protein BP6252_13619 [Coleophoma cylindrospora]